MSQLRFESAFQIGDPDFYQTNCLIALAEHESGSSGCGAVCGLKRFGCVR
jgi:hypothetical protein